MAPPRASLTPPAGTSFPAPIAQVTVVVFGMNQGQSAIEVSYPLAAQPGLTDAKPNQAAFHSLVLAELQTAFQKL